MAEQPHEPGPPMDLANMRRQGVRHLIAYCLNEAAIIIAERGLRPAAIVRLAGESDSEDDL